MKAINQIIGVLILMFCSAGAAFVGGWNYAQPVEQAHVQTEVRTLPVCQDVPTREMVKILQRHVGCIKIDGDIGTETIGCVGDAIKREEREQFDKSGQYWCTKGGM